MPRVAVRDDLHLLESRLRYWLPTLLSSLIGPLPTSHKRPSSIGSLRPALYDGFALLPIAHGCARLDTEASYSGSQRRAIPLRVKCSTVGRCSVRRPGCLIHRWAYVGQPSVSVCYRAIMNGFSYPALTRGP